MANVSYLRPTPAQQQRGQGGYTYTTYGRRSPGPWVPIAVGLAVVVAALVAGAILLATSSASITAGGSGLAAVSMPMGGGTLERVSVTAGPHGTPVAVVVRGDDIFPRRALRAGERVSIEALVRRPGWISWLTGSTQRVTVSTTAPTAQLRSRFLTLRGGEPLRVTFDRPVRMVAYGSTGAMHRMVLSTPQTTVTLPHSSSAGSLMVAGAPRSWERGIPEPVSWFPAGQVRAGAIASPSPGTRLTPDQPITLTFSKPVRSVLKNDPALSPHAPGAWHITSGHTITFQPTGYGYGLGATVKVTLPAGIGLVGGQTNAGGAVATWTVPGGSILRLHQLLATLGYLPVSFHYSGAAPGPSPQAQLTAAVNPPNGTFGWRYANTPAALRSLWSPTTSTVVTKGAIMAFESDHGMVTDGVAGPALWMALIRAAMSGQHSTFGYSFVSVSKASQRLWLWHSGRQILTTLVNTGIAASPTASGTFPVFEHLRVTTMSGTNPDGSHYSDPGIPWTSYFNGGDALHGFIRASYGSPQSLGCVEMPFATAGRVWPYTPIGTLVRVY